jgi:hypothetical protein
MTYDDLLRTTILGEYRLNSNEEILFNLNNINIHLRFSTERIYFDKEINKINKILNSNYDYMLHYEMHIYYNNQCYKSFNILHLKDKDHIDLKNNYPEELYVPNFFKNNNKFDLNLFYFYNKLYDNLKNFNKISKTILQNKELIFTKKYNYIEESY